MCQIRMIAAAFILDRANAHSRLLQLPHEEDGRELKKKREICVLRAVEMVVCSTKLKSRFSSRVVVFIVAMYSSGAEGAVWK